MVSCPVLAIPPPIATAGVVKLSTLFPEIVEFVMARVPD
jgi:hypothetical protein